MLASKPQYAAPLGAINSQTATAYHVNSQRPMTATKVPEGMGYSSPTKSEFSEGQDELSAVRAWDEKKVVAWLHSIKCGQYESIFRGDFILGFSKEV
ncbi:hypothetical protein PENSUB_8106 [Penicillium subrubescens]|uniref:SAM domain-containing protein n=1 Tax=Penicillium subrubescens TaxID=1316194 RepID=A0A1Q5TI48_9EURO|nr:hypothetical protein PENSUB_8106 [Penicillium subrubescens]